MKKFMSFVLVLALAVGMVACGGAAGSTAASTATSGATGAAIKIGGIGPVTGGAAVYGIAVKNGAELAVKEINAKGAQQYELNFQDDEHDAEKAVNAYNNLKDWGMQALMGTVTSTPCIAVAAETATDNMFQLTPSGSAEDCIVNDNAFRVCFSDPEQGTLSADYIAEKALAKKVAIIYDSSDTYSSGIHDAFVTEAKAKGIEIVSDEAFTADSKTDFTVQLQKAQSAGAELVFLPIYYTEASLILTQANKMGYTPKLFGCDGLDGLVAVDNFDTALAENVMLMTPFTAAATDDFTSAFVKSYQESYGEEPNQFAADAYDAIYAIDAACTKAGVTADMDASAICDALKTAFTEIKLDGLTGKSITWDASGAPSKIPAVYTIKNGVYVAA
ncbi:MAG: ABC transporter substrate-binding protein [Ruthenibacterium sp.]